MLAVRGENLRPPPPSALWMKEIAPDVVTNERPTGRIVTIDPETGRYALAEAHAAKGLALYMAGRHGDANAALDEAVRVARRVVGARAGEPRELIPGRDPAALPCLAWPSARDPMVPGSRILYPAGRLSLPRPRSAELAQHLPHGRRTQVGDLLLLEGLGNLVDGVVLLAQRHDQIPRLGLLRLGLRPELGGS